MDVAALAHQGLGQGAGDGVDPLPGGAADEDVEINCHKLPVLGADLSHVKISSDCT